MKQEYAPTRRDESYSMSLHVKEDTEFEISEAKSERDCIGIGGLRIFLSREDLIQLGEAIAAYTGSIVLTKESYEELL